MKFRKDDKGAVIEQVGSAVTPTDFTGEPFKKDSGAPMGDFDHGKFNRHRTKEWEMQTAVVYAPVKTHRPKMKGNYRNLRNKNKRS
jgi:hypothetical protein